MPRCLMGGAAVLVGLYSRCRLSVLPHLMYSRLRGTFLFERIDGVVKVSVAQNRPTYDPIQRHKG